MTYRILLVPVILANLATYKAQAQTVSVTDYGALNNNTNPSVTTAAFLQAFAAASPNGKVIIPGGDYAINNPVGGVVISGFNGEIKFDGQSRLLLQSNSQSGLVFSGGWGLRINGAHLLYPALPATGVSQGTAALEVNGTVNARVSDTIVENSPGYGLWFFNALEPKVVNVTIMSSFDDGVRFENSRNSQVVNATVSSSSGTGVDFVTGSGIQGRTGASGSNLIVTSSLRGIAVSGTSQATVNGFYVESSLGSGIYCGSGTTGAAPDGVDFQNGVINNAGGYGVEVGPVTSCSLANLQVINPALFGVNVAAPQGTVTVRNVRVLGNRSADAFTFTNTAEVLVSECSAENSTGYGFFFDTVSRAAVSGLTTFNVAMANPLHRALWFQNVTSLTASNLVIVDSQAVPSGFVVGTFNVAHGSIQNVASSIVFGALTLQNYSNLPLVQVN